MGANDYSGIDGPNSGNINPATGSAYNKNMGVLLTDSGSTSALAVSTVVRVRDITDGTSKTIMVAEMAGRGFNAKSSQLKISGSWAGGENVANINLAPTPAPTSNLPASGGKLPGDTVYENWCIAYASDELISFHPGGCQVLMADGSAQWIDETTSQPLLWSLASRNGNESIPVSFGN